MTQTAPPRAHSTRRRWWIAAAVVILLVTTFAWALPSVQARGDVRVLPRSMHCGPDDVPYRLVAENGEVPVAAFEVTLRPDSFCQLEITIVNDGSRSVHVSTARFPSMGQIGSGYPFEVTQNGGRFNVKDSGSDDSGDAVLPIDETIAAGGSIDVLFDLRTRESGFRGDPNRTIGLRNLPLLKVSSGGLSGTVEGSVNLHIREKK